MFLSVPTVARPWLIGTTITLTMSNNFQPKWSGNNLPSLNSQLQHDTHTHTFKPPTGTAKSRSYCAYLLISTGRSTSYCRNARKPSNTADTWLISVTNRHWNHTQENNLISSVGQILLCSVSLIVIYVMPGSRITRVHHLCVVLHHVRVLHIYKLELSKKIPSAYMLLYSNR